jgi:hypothetical protein
MADSSSATPAPFERKRPPLIARYLMGAMLDGIARPAVWTMEALGITDRVVPRFMGRVAKRFAASKPFEGYVPTSHDVFVATYVKSGTNWMMQIAHQLLNHGDAEFEHIHCVVPWPDLQNGPMRHYAVPIQDDSIWKRSPEQKRVIKTHFDWKLLPYSEDARYISVIRDPKDVAVSGYHFFARAAVREALSVESWLNVFLSEQFVWGSWPSTTASYWSQRHRPNVLILSFKAMRRDLRGTVCRIAEFLDVRVSDAVIDRVVEKSSFDYMRRMDHQFANWNMVPWRNTGTMVRRGAVGGSGELLTAAQQQRIDEYCRAELRRLGCDLPYEQFCDVAGDSLPDRSQALRTEAVKA